MAECGREPRKVKAELFCCILVPEAEVLARDGLLFQDFMVMRLVFTILVFWLLALESPARQQPNILFIAVDDLNDWVGCLGGHPQARTPHIDALAERGVLFEQTYCAAPLCSPSRTAVMTGLRPSTTGI